MSKKVWQKPALVVLVRTKPEEAVLVVCKNDGLVGPDFEDKWCAIEGDCGLMCHDYSST